MTATYLTTPEAFAGSSLDIEDDAYRHLFKARRLAVGDDIRVVDGEGRARRGRIMHVVRRSARIELGDELPSREPDRLVNLVVGAPRPERASWLVEKATEMGVRRITFVATTRTPRAYGTKTLHRWQRVARSAVEQSGRAVMPEVAGVIPLADALPTLGPVWALVPGAPRLSQHLDSRSAEAAITLVIGPEGGLTEEDLAIIEGAGGLSAGLGDSVLRVETAALAALACVLFSSGEAGK